MVLIRVVLMTLWVLAFFAGREIFTPHVSAVHQPPNTAVFRLPSEDVSQVAVEGAQPLRDVYGNEIDAAVGEYRVDPGGDLYEQHDPDTALLKLGPAGV